MSNTWTIQSILEGYKSKELTEQEVFDHFYHEIDEHEHHLNALITTLPLGEIKKTLPKGAIPVVHKDMFSTKGIKTTAASKILETYVPPFNATAVNKLNDAHFVTIGKANCDAFAHGSTGMNSDFGATRNPYAINRTPGGSSSGSAAAVAAGLTPAATATDTGGSIRLPASFTNTVGLKPTYGRVSRYGVISMTSSTDSIGHITKTVWDSAYILGITAGLDSLDATTSSENVPTYTQSLSKGIKGLKIGVPNEYIDGLDQAVKDQFESAIKTLTELGAEIIPVSLPHTQYALATYYIITPAEVSSNLGRFDGIRYGNARSSFGAEAKRRIMIGTHVLSSGYYDEYYLKAQKVRTLIKEDFTNAFNEVDVLVAPTSPTPPPILGQNEDDPLKTYMMDVLTVPINIAGVPALSVPAGFSPEGLPIGIQFIGNYYQEELLYQCGFAFEQSTMCYKVKPEYKEVL